MGRFGQFCAARGSLRNCRRAGLARYAGRRSGSGCATGETLGHAGAASDAQCRELAARLPAAADPGYLALYNDAKAEYAASLAELRASLADRPRRASQIAAAARIGREKFAELDQTIALGQTGEFDAAMAIARSGAGKALMDQLRRVMDGLTTDANHEVDQTTATQTSLNTLLIGAIIIALLCVAGLGVVLLKNVRLHLAVLETRAAGNRQLADALEDQVAQRTQELVDANQRFNAALRSSGVTVLNRIATSYSPGSAEAYSAARRARSSANHSTRSSPRRRRGLPRP